MWVGKTNSAHLSQKGGWGAFRGTTKDHFQPKETRAAGNAPAPDSSAAARLQNDMAGFFIGWNLIRLVDLEAVAVGLGDE